MLPRLIESLNAGYEGALHHLSTREESLGDDELRYALATSSRWNRLVAGIDLMTMATTSPLRIEDFTAEQHSEVRRWIDGDVPDEEVPSVLADYLAPLRGKS